MASFVPTFTPTLINKNIAVTVGPLDELDIERDLESKYQFIFLIDRSNSMGNYNRMKITIDAIILFLQSLPSGCKFGILSFGSNS
jgi:Mg-chelatase subunit ChlD